MNLRVAFNNGRTVNISTDFPFDKSPVGYRVIVSSRTGVVVGYAKSGKSLQAHFPDANPLVLPEHIEVIKEISEMYGLTPWSFLFSLLPKVFIWKEEEYIVPPQIVPQHLDKASMDVIRYLLKKKRAKPKSLEKKFGGEVIRFLLEKGFLRREKVLEMPDRTEEVYRLVATMEQVHQKIRRSKRKQSKLDIVLFLMEKTYATREEIKEMGHNPKDIDALVRMGLLRKEKLVEERKDIEHKVKTRMVREIKGSYVFVGVADTALDRLKSLIESTLEKGSILVFCSSRSTLLWLEDELKKHFGDVVLSLTAHKKLSKDWFRCQEGKRVILGTKVALLSPIRDLFSVAIFDDVGIKMKDGVDTRNFLFLLSKHTGAEFALFLPSFDIQTYHFVLSKRVPYEYKKPSADVLVFGIRSGEVLTQGCKDVLKDSRDVLFLVSKSGYGYAYCPRCESLALCPLCNTFLTFYKEKGKLICTNCGYKSGLECPNCGGEVKDVGFGIERVMEEIGGNFSFSTYPNWGKRYDIVVVLSADTFLSYPSFQSEENFYRYIWRAYSLARRIFVVQSLFPESKVIKGLLRGDWKKFLDDELRRRKEEDLPPFSRLLIARFKKDVEKKLKAHQLSYNIRKYGELTEIMLKTKKTKSLLRLLRSLRPTSLEVL